MPTIKNWIYWIILGIRAVLFPLSKIPFVIVILLVGFYALYINDQGQDLMAAFTAKSIFNSSYLLFFELFLVGWAIAVWNVSRILLTAANLSKLVQNQIPEKDLGDALIKKVHDNKWVVASIDPNYKSALEFMIKLTPRLLALCPYLIFIAAYVKQYGTFFNSFKGGIISIVIAGILHFLYMVYLKKLWYKITGKPIAASNEYSIDGQKGFFNALKKASVRTNTILTIIMVAIMFGYAVWAAQLVPSTEGKPGLILLAGFTFYTLIGLVFNLIINWFRIPVFMLLVLFAIFFALKKNDNHTIQTIGTDDAKKILQERKNWRTDSAYAEYWLRKKIAEKIIDTTKPSNIFIITAEGGGSRNCYWTYAVLRQLHQYNPELYDRTFAVTGVSGGSIGLGFYYNYRYVIDSLKRAGADTLNYSSKIDDICASDYLSRVTYGFLFPDLLQRFIPFRFDSWDRSKFLSNSFDDGFSCKMDPETNHHYLSRNYLGVWSDTSTAYRYPAMLFNSIFNEDGQKAVYSPFMLSDTYYTGVMDILSEMNRSVPMKEAMVSSARFPVLMAPGLIWRDKTADDDKKKNNSDCKGDSCRLGHLSDGGGFENTGIQTGQQTALLLQSIMQHRNLLNKIHINIIYIGTGAGDISIDDGIPGHALKHHDPIGSSYEVAWLNGGLNTVFGWIIGSHNMVKRISPNLAVTKIGLQIKEDSAAHALPLGWYLSDSSKIRMSRQATFRVTKDFSDRLNVFQPIKIN